MMYRKLNIAYEVLLISRREASCLTYPMFNTLYKPPEVACPRETIPEYLVSIEASSGTFIIKVPDVYSCSGSLHMNGNPGCLVLLYHGDEL
jgi:hypothetical protein